MTRCGHSQVRLTSLAGQARLLSASIALWVLVLSPASAATDIQGTPDDLRLNVDKATLVEVLNALSTRFKISYKLRSHNPRVLTGHYSGTLRETLTRLLDGNDYFLEVSDKGLEIIVLGASDQQRTLQRQVASTSASAPSPSAATVPPPAVHASTPTPSAASSRSVSPSVPAPSASSVPPLSSFAVVPAVTP